MAVSRIDEAGLNVTQYGNRNLIINGAMRVHQRSGTIAVTSSSVYTLDRFEAVLGGSYTVGVNVTQDSDAPDDFTNCLKVDVTSTSTPATSNNFMIAYHPESQDLVHLNWGSSSGKYLTLSFWVKSNKTGTYGFSILHHGKTRNWLSSYTIDAADTWEYKTILIDPDTSTAFDDDNEMSLRLLWHLSDGPDDLTAAHSWEADGSYQSITGQVNLCDSTSNYFQITGVQLEVGDTATPFEHRSYGDELLRCQRYFHRIGGSTGSGLYDAVGSGVTVNGTTGYINVALKVQMRAKPSVTFTGTLSMHAGTTAPDLDNSNFTNYLDKNGGLLAPIRDGGTAFTTGNGLIMYCQNSADSADFDAEL